ncbi:MAG: hypothetical protein PHQ43_11690 [Dehalococcoidales bacterium]|nr:hypothetical protein [Dehalococcoidales bacterium]
MNHENGAENTERYPASGTYISPVIDFGAIAAWGEMALSATETLLGGAVSYFTRSSSDNVSWSEWVASVGGTIASSASRYFQWKADLSPSEGRVEAPTISNMTISYVEDNTPPTNPSETATGYSSGVGTTEVTSNTGYN